ncbi:hypothetical protein C475_12250 [Halosimplex carlsbadense 2-9-1]|uniref:Uncharacterized protein n=1 Tax=Halosimplex carlsbadense 2-9-1 TaxID=797114 RepID=M0CMN9_9EURY|nr:hypothetical protein [Halosimplex carlsbadense]ELZ24510.1 hypothetical protein C475_12250 [Halosimplex carlsbadense 2-9-1]
MSRTVDLSVPRWVRILFVFFLLGGAFVTGAAALLDTAVQALGLAENAYVPSLGLAVFAYLVVCSVWFARTTDSDGSSVWSAIPDSQYTGRHAESGGIARKEQEDAIRELQEREE